MWFHVVATGQHVVLRVSVWSISKGNSYQYQFWALTTRFQPATDMYVIPRGITGRLEPSMTSDGVTSKLIAELTTKEGFRGEVGEPTLEMREFVKKMWRSTGLMRESKNNPSSGMAKR